MHLLATEDTMNCVVKDERSPDPQVYFAPPHNYLHVVNEHNFATAQSSCPLHERRSHRARLGDMIQLGGTKRIVVKRNLRTQNVVFRRRTHLKSICPQWGWMTHLAFEQVAGGALGHFP